MVTRGQNQGGNQDENRDRSRPETPPGRSGNQGARDAPKRASELRSPGASQRTGHERGFAAMDEAQQRRIARKGGTAVSEDRAHMAEIGRKGGAASRSRAHHQGDDRGARDGGRGDRGL
jgi:general stress protein YciG